MVRSREQAAVESLSYSQAFCWEPRVTSDVGFSQKEAQLHLTLQGTRYHATLPCARKHPFTLFQAVTQREAYVGRPPG